jgi:DNA-directed RNA polymerase subunit M/transcription elongation factor TFIIS
LAGLSDVEQSVWQSFYGETTPRKACDLRDYLYSQAVEAVLYGDLDPSKVVPTSVLVETNVQSLPLSTEQSTHAVFSELRDQLLKCMDGKLDLPACPSCKTDEFMSSCLIQVRSGDEAMGVFPQCLKCKHIVRTHR